MVASLYYCHVSGSVVPIGSDGQPMLALAAKLARNDPLTPAEAETVARLRPMLQITSRRGIAGENLFLALRVMLKRDGRSLVTNEIIDRFSPNMTLIGKDLIIPRDLRSRMGQWVVAVGYSAIHDYELVPKYVPQILESLPYVFDDENAIEFAVSERDRVLPNGEWSRRRDSDRMAQSGNLRPDQI